MKGMVSIRCLTCRYGVGEVRGTVFEYGCRYGA